MSLCRPLWLHGFHITPPLTKCALSYHRADVSMLRTASSVFANGEPKRPLRQLVSWEKCPLCLEVSDLFLTIGPTVGTLRAGARVGLLPEGRAPEAARPHVLTRGARSHLLRTFRRTSVLQRGAPSYVACISKPGLWGKSQARGAGSQRGWDSVGSNFSSAWAPVRPKEWGGWGFANGSQVWITR